MRLLRQKKRLLIFIVAYNAEKTIEQVISRIPASLEEYDTEILVIDDSSSDNTFERAHGVTKTGQTSFPLTVICNPVNQGYGGNQKIGFHYAIHKNFDFVALVLHSAISTLHFSFFLWHLKTESRLLSTHSKRAAG